MKYRSMRMLLWSIMKMACPARSKNKELLVKLIKIWGVIGLVNPSDRLHRYSSMKVISVSGLIVSSFSMFSYHW